MYRFIGENYLFLLTLIGAVLTFVASFTRLVTKHKPVLFLAVLLGLGFVVACAYQTLSYLDRQAADLINDAAGIARLGNIMHKIIESIPDRIGLRQDRISA